MAYSEDHAKAKAWTDLQIQSVHASKFIKERKNHVERLELAIHVLAMASDFDDVCKMIEYLQDIDTDG